MLAVASPPLSLNFDHDRPRSPGFGPLNPTNGALNTLDDLLKHPLEFKQGSLTPTSGVLTAGIAEGKYKPINDGPLSEDEDDIVIQNPSAPAVSSKQPLPAEKLFSCELNMDWPAQIARHPGFNNAGNTCFLNSVLQCMFHTPPLLNVLLEHKQDKLGFCMICLLRDLARSSFINKKRTTHPVLDNLNKIAKGMRRGRQEDAHEFLRYTIDTLQRSALAIHSSTSSTHPIPGKIPPSLAETSWVHAIFGGRLRSRVCCRTCGHCSDTFDSLLDLSVDINRVQSLARALAQFVKPEVLSGDDAYRCEKCKKPVTAEKFMTIHEAPVCLTIHLKRFTPTGKKNSNLISYPEVLDVQQYMSEGQTSKKYLLYGVIHHWGQGPNHGHYTAHVKGAGDRWTLMDDDSVASCMSAPVNKKDAYVLFYMQSDKAQPTPGSSVVNGGQAFGGTKRTREDMESNGAGKSKGALQTITKSWDLFPPATKKTRVENSNNGKEGVAGPSRPAPIGVASSSTRPPLVGYPDDEIEDSGEVVSPSAAPVSSTASPMSATTTPSKTATSKAGKSAIVDNPSPVVFNTISTFSSSIPASTFYGPSKQKPKDKRGGSSPWTIPSGPGNLYAKKEKLEMKDKMGFDSFGPNKSTKTTKVKSRMRGKST